VGCGAGPLGQPSRWLLGQEPMRAQYDGRGPFLTAGPKSEAVNSTVFLLSFVFQKHVLFVVYAYLLFFLLSYISV
jgi:hypothetical protein